MYDYLHRRISKTIHSPLPAVHSYIYDGWNLAHETIEVAGGTVSEIQYFWGNDLSGTLQGAVGVGGLLAVSIDGQFYLPCQDANGEQKSAKLKCQRRATAILRPTQRVGARSRLRRRSANIAAYINESGAVVASYEYDAFGATIAQTGSHADIFRFRFSTKYHDPETGLYYYGYRFYDPPRGRWLNRDPIEEDGGLNLYAFCRNDGVNGVDPWGQRTWGEDVEAYAFLQSVEFACRLRGRSLTGKLLSIYLDKNNSGEYKLTDDEVMKIITNDGFRKKLGKQAWEIIVDKGPGKIQHRDTALSEHRFYNNPDGDLWFAFNDIRFKLALDGCIKTEGADKLRFHGNMTADLSDYWTFGDPRKASRTPFQFWSWLPDRYQFIPEQRFLDLEMRGWVKPFKIIGRRHASYTITVNCSNSSSAEVRYDSYNR